MTRDRADGTPTVAFAGGGTGGHTASGLAILEAARAAGEDPRTWLLGTDREAERALVGTARVPHRAICREVGSGPARRLRRLAGLPAAALRAGGVLRRLGASVVCGLGGYAMVPTVLAARVLGIPYVLIEQNAVPGRATRLLAGGAAAVLCPCPEAARSLGEGAVVTGAPVRERAVRPVPRVEARRALGLPVDAPCLLVQGGSQGARALNRAALRAAPRVGEAGAVVCHLAGADGVDEAARVWREAGVPAHVTAFQEDVALTYRAADVVVARAGGTSIAEMLCSGLPMILVPYPHARDDHQTANARAATAGGAGAVVDQAEVDEALARAVHLLGEPARRARMARAAAWTARPRAARRAWRILVRAARGTGEPKVETPGLPMEMGEAPVDGGPPATEPEPVRAA